MTCWECLRSMVSKRAVKKEMREHPQLTYKQAHKIAKQHERARRKK